MADKPTTTYALLEFGGRCIVLPADAATEAFRVLCKGEIVEYDWGNKSYRRVVDPHVQPTLKVFTATQYAQLALEDPAE